MLRGLVLLLLLANLAFFAWTQGWIDDVVGVRAQGDREPERLGRQVQPELVQILSPQAARAASAPAGPGAPTNVPLNVPLNPPAVPAPAASPAATVAPVGPLTCLEAGPFVGGDIAAAEAAVRAALPEGSWVSVKSSRPGMWMVYMGKFKDRDELVKKTDELRLLKVEYDDLRNSPELAPGLSLGRFEERGNALNALEKFSLRGIRSARVIEVRAPATSVTLRVDKAAPALATQVAALSTSALGSRGFVPCARSAGN